MADHEKLAIELLLASVIPVAPPQLNGALHCDREFVGSIHAYRKKGAPNRNRGICHLISCG